MNHHSLLGRFRSDTRELPVLWHQSLLAFVQHYRQDISTGTTVEKTKRGCLSLSLVVVEQKQALLELLRHQLHHTVGPEIRQLLAEYKCRDEEDEQYAVMDDAE